jgi:hypothetical protein
VRKKKENKPRERSTKRNAGDLDWKPLYRALQDSIEWALDVAATLAAPYPEEVDAIERVRAFVRAKLAGRSAEIRIDDLMLAFGILIAAIERDIGPIRITPTVRLALLTGGPQVPTRLARPAPTDAWLSSLERFCPGVSSLVPNFYAS